MYCRSTVTELQVLGYSIALCAATYYNYHKIMVKGSDIVPRAAHGVVEKLQLGLPKAAAEPAVKDVQHTGKVVYVVAGGTDDDVQLVLQQQRQHMLTTGRCTIAAK
jgi:hypothetical protein